MKQVDTSITNWQNPNNEILQAAHTSEPKNIQMHTDKQSNL